MVIPCQRCQHGISMFRSIMEEVHVQLNMEVHDVHIQHGMFHVTTGAWISLLIGFHVHPMFSVNMRLPRWERQHGSLHVSTEQGNSMLNIVHSQP